MGGVPFELLKPPKIVTTHIINVFLFERRCHQGNKSLVQIESLHFVSSCLLGLRTLFLPMLDCAALLRAHATLFDGIIFARNTLT